MSLRFPGDEYRSLLRGHASLCNAELDPAWLHGDDKVVEMEVDELDQLTAQLKLPISLLLPFNAESATSNRLLVLHETDFTKHTNKWPGVEYYAHPERRLTGADDFVISLVRFSPRSAAEDAGEPHAHHGEEIVLVRKGRLEVELHGRGCKYVVDEHEYFHFHSDEKHTLRNASDTDPCEVLTLRIGQFGKTGLRRWTLNHLAKTPVNSRHELLTKLRHQDPESKSWQNRVWVDSAEHLWPLKSAKTFVDGISDKQQLALADPIGFAYFVHCHAAGRSFDAISESVRDSWNGDTKAPSKATIRRCCNSQRAVDWETAWRIGEALNMPMTHLVDFLYPTASPAVTVGPNDFHQPALEGLGLQSGRVFQWPIRRLKYSHVSIFRLKFENDEPTKPNKHAGFEFIYPLSGRFMLQIGNDEPQLCGEETICMHFESGIEHRLWRDGDEPAEALFMRIYNAI